MVLGMASMALVVVEAARLLLSSVGVMTWEESLRRFGMLSVAHEYHPAVEGIEAKYYSNCRLQLQTQGTHKSSERYLTQRFPARAVSRFPPPSFIFWGLPEINQKRGISVRKQQRGTDYRCQLW